MECQSAGMDLMTVEFKATHVGSKFTCTRLRFTLPMTGLLFFWRRMGMDVEYFLLFGQSTLPHENSFTFFSCSVMEGPCSYFYFLLSDSELSHSLMAACTFLFIFTFLLTFIAALVGINTVLCSYGIKQPRVHPQVRLYCSAWYCPVLPSFLLSYCCFLL